MLLTEEFDRPYLRVVRQFAQLGTDAERAAAGTSTLDRSLAGVGASASTAAAGLTRAERATVASGAAESKAATAAARHATAVARVAEIMSVVTTDAQRMQQAELRLVAAQERLNALTESGTATTRQLAAAQSGLIGAQRSLATAQAQGAGRMSTLTGSMDAQAASMARVEALMARYAGESTQVQQAALRQAAAQERLVVLQESSTATAGQLAAAQASLVGATDRVAAAQTAAAGTAARQGEANAAAATGTRGASAAMAGLVRTAAGLGIAIGVFEAIKKAIDIGKAATVFQREMLLIQTQAGATVAEVAKMTPAVLALAGPMATAPEKLANSLYHAYSVTKNQTQALNIMKIAAEGAKVGHADLEETTNALTASVASGIPGVKNYTQAMGALNAIVGAGDMKMSDLNAAMASGLMVTMKNYGLSLVDVGGALATFGDHNIRGANAATQLRMTVMALAVPARGGEKVLGELGLTSEGSAKELEKLGLKTGDLAKDLQSGGLNKAVLDLKGHLDKAGISTAQTGTVLTQVFGKRAGVGLQVLIGDLPRFEQKLKQVADGAGGFGAAWAATTHSASFAFQKLGIEAQVAGLTLVNKLMPSITTAAQWLGTNLPNAISRVQDTLAPLEHIVGGALTLAWRGLVAVLGVASGSLGSIGGVLASHKALVTAVGTAVIGMWAAYKGVAIAKAALIGLDALLGRLAARAPGVGQAIGGAFTSANVAMLGAGAALGILAYAWQQNAAATAANKAQIEAYTAAIEADNGALGDTTRKLVEDNLSKADAYQIGLKLGISQKTLTDAVLGNAAALKTVTDAQMQKNAVDKAGFWGGIVLQASVKGNTEQLGKGAQAARDKAAADAGMSHTTGQVTQAQKDATTVINGTTVVMKDQTSAADALNAALATLSGDANAAALSQLSFEDGLIGVTAQIRDQAKQFKDSGTSLAENTAEGNKNLEWLHQQIDAINNVANAQFKAGDNVDQVTKKMGTNEASLRKAALAAGLNAVQVDALIKKYAAVPAQVKTAILSDATPALDAIKKVHDAGGKPIRTTHTIDTGPAMSALRRVFNFGHETIHTVEDVHTVYHTKSGTKFFADGGGVPGVGSTDSVPAMLTPGEWVSTTDSTKRNEAALAAGNRGAKLGVVGFATGGKVTPAGARVAANAAQALAKLRIVIDTTDVSKFLHALTGTAGQISTAEKTLADAVTKAGGGTRLAHSLAKENNTLLALAGSRAGIANRLKAANTALAAVQTKYNDERNSVASTITGSFDVTGAGFSADQILANVHKAGADAALFKAQLAQVKALGLNKNLLAQFAEKGIAAEPALQALAGASKGQIADLNRSVGTLGGLGNAIGKQAADSLYGAGVDAAKGLVAGLKSQDAALLRTMRHLADIMVAELRTKLKMHSPSRVGVELGKNYAGSVASGIVAKHGEIRRAAQGMGVSAIPGSHGPGTSDAYGAAAQIHLTNYTLPGQSNNEIGAVAAAQVAWALRR